jgi:hypothetical protein
MSASDTTWLDALARRAASRETRGPIDAPGMSRRMLLRLTGAAVLAGGTLRLGVPAAALAQDSAACIKERTKENLITLQECQRGGEGFYQNARSRYTAAVAFLQRSDITARERKAAKRQMSRAMDDMVAALGDKNQCIADFNKRQNDSKFNCQVIGPPQPPQPGDQPAQPPRSTAENGTCPGDTFPCVGHDGVCCYAGTFCCGCGCCIYADCRCCVPGS